MASLHKCGKIWTKKDCANILHHLESCHVASKCLVCSRSPHSKLHKWIAFDCAAVTIVLLFVVKNDIVIETLFFWKQASKSGCALYTGAHYTRVNTVYNLYFKESEGLIVEFVEF